MPDPRVRQFWDPNHEVSKALTLMAAARLSASRPGTGTDTTNGFHWDEAIVYAPHSKWQDAPAPLFWRGPVYLSISGLAASLRQTTQNAVHAKLGNLDEKARTNRALP